MVLLGLFLFVLVINSLLSNGLVILPIAGGHFVGSLLIDGLGLLGIIFVLWIMGE
jgi:hypothetical protein